MQFFETLMGKRFYESTMPMIARNLEIIAKNMEKQKASPQYMVVCWNNFSNKLTPLCESENDGKTKVFDTFEDALNNTKKELVDHFNSNGWEDKIVSTISEIEKLGYIVTRSEDDMTFELSASEEDADVIRYTIIKISA